MSIVNSVVIYKAVTFRQHSLTWTWSSCLARGFLLPHCKTWQNV